MSKQIMIRFPLEDVEKMKDLRELGFNISQLMRQLLREFHKKQMEAKNE